MFWGRVVFIVISYKLTVFLYQRNEESRFTILHSHPSFESGHRTIWHCVFDRQSILRLSTWYLIVISTITIHYYTIWVLCYLTTIISFLMFFLRVSNTEDWSFINRSLWSFISRNPLFKLKGTRTGTRIRRLGYMYTTLFLDFKKWESLVQERSITRGILFA